jgi:integrase
MLHFLLQICSTSRWSDGQEPQVASIRKRGDLQWEVRVRRKGYPTICKTFDRKKDAELWAKEQETVMGRGRFVDRRPAERTTLGSALERYLEHEVPKKKGHQLAYMVHAWMACDLSLRPLASLRGADFAAWRDRRLNSVKRFEDVFDPETGTARREPRFIEPKTVRNELGVISHLFTVARTEWGFEELLNPIQEIKMPKPSEPRNRRLEQDEEERLLKACAADAGAPWLKPLVVLAIETAMRRGELLKLSWEHIDLQRATAFLPDIKDPNLTRSRTVPLSSRAVETLKEIRSAPYLHLRRVIPASADQVDHAYRAAVRRAGIEDLTFHDLRHEATSRLAPIYQLHELAAITGHRNYQTLRRYYHPKAEELAVKMRKADAAGT